MSKGYNPGLHIVASFNATEASLTDKDSCQAFYNDLIAEVSLTKVGEVYHGFDTGGFTAVICLTESHISIHTWPEFGLATFDVFLSNFKNDNSDKARIIYQRTLNFFNATEIGKEEIMR